MTAMSADLHLDCPLRYTDYQRLEKWRDFDPPKPEGYCSHAGDFPGTRNGTVVTFCTDNSRL